MTGLRSRHRPAHRAAVVVGLILALALALVSSCRRPVAGDSGGTLPGGVNRPLPATARSAALSQLRLEYTDTHPSSPLALHGVPEWKAALLEAETESGYFAIVDLGPAGIWASTLIASGDHWRIVRHGDLTAALRAVGGEHAAPSQWLLGYSPHGLWGTLADARVHSVVADNLPGDVAPVLDGKPVIAGGLFFLPMRYGTDSHQQFWLHLTFFDKAGVEVRSGVFGTGLSDIVPPPGDWDEVDPAFSPDGRYLAYARNTPSGAEICLLPRTADVADIEVVYQAPGYNFYRLSWSPDASRLAFVAVELAAETNADEMRGKALALNVATGEVADIQGATWISAEYHFQPFSWSADSRRLVTYGVPTSMWDFSTGRWTQVGKPGDKAQPAAISPDGRYVGMLRYQEGGQAIVVFDLESNESRVLLCDKFEDFHEGLALAPSWSGNDRMVLSTPSSRRFDKFETYALIEVDLSGNRRVLADPGWGGYLSPDRMTAAFVAPADEFQVCLALYDLQSGEVRRLGEPGSVLWSPDSTRLLEWGLGSMTVYDLSTGASAVNAHGLQCDWFPSWSPDGKQIAMAYHIAGRRVVRVDDVDEWLVRR